MRPLRFHILCATLALSALIMVTSAASAEEPERYLYRTEMLRAAPGELAAVAAGFTSASTIGTYLRELIAQHHDTLAVAVR